MKVDIRQQVFTIVHFNIANWAKYWLYPLLREVNISVAAAASNLGTANLTWRHYQYFQRCGETDGHTNPRVGGWSSVGSMKQAASLPNKMFDVSQNWIRFSSRIFHTLIANEAATEREKWDLVFKIVAKMHHTGLERKEMRDGKEHLSKWWIFLFQSKIITIDGV